MRVAYRRLVFLAAATAAVTALTACGGDESDPGAAAGPTTVAGAEISQDAELHGALPDRIKKAGTVRVATDVPYAPFEMFVKEGRPELTGLDYDLGQALGAKLGVRFVFTPQKFDGIIPGIQAGKFDVAMSAITDTEERQQILDFVDYSQSGSGLLVAEGNPEKVTTLDDLCGKPVGVQAATNQFDLLKAHQAECRKAGKGEIAVRTFPKDSDAQLALRAGKVVADVLTKPAAGWTAKTADGGKAFDVAEDPAATGGYNASPNGIAVSKKTPQLTDAIQRALQQLMDDGTVKKICDKYGVGSIALAEATKNAAVS
ncbi:polar amino acid transport system substrate-binding protein [Streptomyces sp. 3330]|uniref:ABC transporter substrate-binding protein n=1 Tax=Streptomyces sp. 3330 TaxID=2817755 RepID=UPI00285946CB|nr:ABC transporter substrate-binding protein [Streptomyces sp. 3330]MDR6980742.1 polar amino acid transport system substrate-binding protein [Streptomyces sp. 3330]